MSYVCVRCARKNKTDIYIYIRSVESKFRLTGDIGLPIVVDAEEDTFCEEVAALLCLSCSACWAAWAVRASVARASAPREIQSFIISMSE